MPKLRKTSRHLLRTIRHALVYSLTTALRIGILIFTLPWARRVGARLGVWGFALFRSERRKALRNIELAYGNSLTPQERMELGRSVFRNAGRAAAEIAFLYSDRGKEMLESTPIEGLEHLLGVLESGRGALVVTAHFGNWELMPPLLARVVPSEGSVVARDLSNPWLNELGLRFRRRAGVTVFRRGVTGREYVRFLRQGNVLGILGDMDTTRGNGLFVDFFNRPAWTQQGIARLALAGNAPIIPAFMMRDREDPNRQILRIGEPLAEPEVKDKEEWVARMTQAFTSAIEAAVREQPEMWMWMHRRWRHRPDESFRHHRLENPESTEGQAEI